MGSYYHYLYYCKHVFIRYCDHALNYVSQRLTFKQKHESQKISSFAAAFVWLAIMGAVLVISTVHYGGAIWLDFMYYLSVVKLSISFIKYLPQVNLKHQYIVFSIDTYIFNV